MAGADLISTYVPTAAGQVTLVGRFDTFRNDRPVILVLPGALQAPHGLFPLADMIPEADVVVALLPGMYAAGIPAPSVGAFARMMDEIAVTRFPGRRLLRFGFSAGGLVAMAMREGGAFVAVDAPLTTAALWPLVAPMRAELAQGENPRLPAWAWEILGIAPDRLENRDYRPLLETLNAPGVFVIAGQPLEPPRDLARPPGALTAADRDLVTATPGVTAMVVAGVGHDVLAEAPRAIRLAAERGLALLGGENGAA